MSANKSGKLAEDTLASVLRNIGLPFTRQALIGRSIFNTALHADFVVQNLKPFPNGLAIESKWQESDGSVDEKLPYLVENICRCYPIPAVIVVGGGALRSGAWAYVRARVDGQRLLNVFTFEEFMTWARRSKLEI